MRRKGDQQRNNRNLNSNQYKPMWYKNQCCGLKCTCLRCVRVQKKCAPCVLALPKWMGEYLL